MRFLRDMPIQTKFTWITMTISGVALLLAGGTFAVYEATVFRKAMRGTLAGTGVIVAANSAAPLEFGDAVAAQETLAALAADPHILAAAVYDQSGQLFATYARENAPEREYPPAPDSDRNDFEAGHLKVFQTIVSDGTPIGSIYIESDLKQLYTWLGGFAWMVLATLLCVWLVAFALSSVLQRFVSRPILDLARMATLVSERKDYSIRAEGQRGDEIGVLIDRFNEMLAQIGERDSALKHSHEELEVRVDERTRKLRTEIHERKKMQDELWLAKRAAEQGNVAKSAFLANMSHELRTPLNAIIGYSEMLEEDAESQGQGALSLDLRRIHSAGRHLLSLINDILDLSKIEAGRMELLVEDFDLNELVEEVMSTIMPLAVGNRLEFSCDTDIGEIQTDRTKLKQALLNLLSNACKFTEDGSVTLEVTRETTAAEDWIRLSVTDDGIGLSEEQQSRLFQEFTQFNSSPERKHGGTGLGLAISDRFCRMMGGDIRVASALSCGSTFEIRIPAMLSVSSGQSAQDSDPDRDTTPSGRNPDESEPRPVLVIDADPERRAMLVDYLEREGLASVTARNEGEALELARIVRPLAITTTVRSGESSLDNSMLWLEQDLELREIPIVHVTFDGKDPRVLPSVAADAVDDSGEPEPLTTVLKSLAAGISPSRAAVRS